MTSRTQHPAVNHLQKFVEEEFALGRGHTLITAFTKSYEHWCDCRDVRHRRLTPVMLLDQLKQQYGIEPCNVRFVRDGEERFVYGLPGIAFKHDESLNDRLKRRGLDVRTVEHGEDDDESEDERRKRKRREYYLKYKARRAKEKQR